MRVEGRLLRLALATTGAVALAGCATADLRPGGVRHETPKQIREKFHGPDVSVRAFFVYQQNTRVIEPVVSLADSAFLIVGDIGSDGTLRIIYPTRPGEPNLVQKTDRFRVPGFSPRLILPLITSSRASNRSPVYLAPGNVFVIASSKPLSLEKLAEDGRWSLFDVYYDNHLYDPKLAITDLAAAVSSDVSDVSIAYVPYGRGTITNRTVEPTMMPQGSIRRRGRPPT